MKKLLIVSLSLFSLVLTGCSVDKLPGVYRIDIQQGNEVSQDMLAKLEPGMNKNQVAFIMGTPLLINTFHPNRWDYIYSYQPGNGVRQQRRISLYFDDQETLSYVEGDTRTVSRDALATEDRTDHNVVVPLTEKKTGFFRGVAGFLGFGREEDTSTTPATEPNPVDAETEFNDMELSPENIGVE